MGKRCAYDSWRAYRETVARHKRGGRSSVDQGSYLPSPDEILRRRHMLHALKDWGFNDLFIANVMLYDTPEFIVVVASVAKYGVAGTWERFREFMDD